MEVFTQPKITGYRQLSEEEVALMNEGKELAERCGEYVAKLRRLPQTRDEVPMLLEIEPGKFEPTVDQRWISDGATDLQKGFMFIMRGIAQPTTF